MGVMPGGTLGLPAGLPSESILTLTPEYESGETGITGQPAQAVGYDPFVRWVNREISLAEPHIMVQRDQMREAWRFYDGHQLSDEDLSLLRAAKRPDTAINEIQKFIKFASGIERRTQQALMFVARTLEDEQAQAKGELVTKVLEWFVEQSSGQFERSLAFESKLVCGIGICDLGLSRASDPQGAPRYNFCDAGEFWFPQCAKQNFGLDTPSPVRWLARETDMDVDEAIRKWPDAAMFIRAAAGSGPDERAIPDFGRGAGRPVNYVVPWIMTEPLNKTGGGSGKPGKVPILEFQYYEDEPGYFFFDPIQRDATWLNDAEFRKVRRGYRALHKVEITDFDKQEHRVFKRAFLLQRRILLAGPKPLPTRDAGYTWNVMTGAWDRTDKTFYGFLRVVMNPQRYANAFFRQVLEVMGASTKGGYLAESGAITVGQKRDIEETGARPGSVNIVQPGAIAGNRILPKPIPQMPQGSLQVLQFCIDIMEKITGLSMSLLGTPQSNTPGVSLRKQLTSGMVLLASEFDALSRFRKREGRLVFEFMRLLADDRVVRIGGACDAQYIRLTKDPFAIKYDLILDENDQDPNLRQYYTDQIVAIAPILIRTGNFFPELLDYINLPVQFRQKLKQGMQRSEQAKMQMAQMGISPGGRGKPRGLEEIKADTALKQARAAEHMAKAKSMGAGIARDDLRSIFDALLNAKKVQQGDRKLSLEALDRLFEGLRPQKSGAAA